MIIPKNFIFLLCVLCLFCLIVFVNGQTSPDSPIMMTIRRSLTLPSSVIWSGSNPCNWSCVQCDTSNRVTKIQIGKKGISGTLPRDLRNLTALTTFEVMGNNLTGQIPNLSGLKSLEVVYFGDNGFTSIPKDFFTGLSSLQDVSLDNNPFKVWEIPLSLKDVTSLVNFSAVNSSLQGKLVWDQTFPSLKILKLSFNQLVGELPMSLSESPIEVLWLNGQNLNGQKLNGSISVLQNMTSLTEVFLNGNSFSGAIPDLSGLTSLKKLNIRDNQLTGTVPSSLTDSKSLSVVKLGNNLLQGPTPSFNPNVDLDISGLNSFCLNTSGTPCDPRVNMLLLIVESFGYPKNFAQRWKGNDPCSSKDPWLGITCVGGNITVINFSNMGLTGTISPRLGDLASLQVINLSKNSLNGSIPQELTKLSSLKNLDVSSNGLCGKVPAFSSTIVLNTNGNPDIGKDCPKPSPGSPGSSGGSSKKRSSKGGKIAGCVIGVLLGLILIGFLVHYLVKKKKQSLLMHHKKHYSDQDPLKITIDNLCSGSSESGLSGNEGNIVFSLQTLKDATDNFDEKNILGRGGFGIVYKGELQDGTTVAVKRMEASVISGKGTDEFKSEIAVLTRVRHRNLVALHGYCLEGNERLLVYQYMPQGTLSRHLFHWEQAGLQPLEWSRRLIIALDVARGVEYLHTLAHQSFIHRDLKCANILIGDDMHAKVADFGLVRLAPEGTQSVETKIAGTFGYLAPEYAVTGRVTTKVDVYSFGVILMELLTGQKALDVKRSQEDVHLATWFKRMFINKATFPEAIDKTIEVDEEIRPSIYKVAELANQCSSREPYQRPDMNYVVNVLVSLVVQWTPTEQEVEDVPQISFDSAFFGCNTVTSSIPSRPSDNTFRSGRGR